MSSLEEWLVSVAFLVGVMLVDFPYDMFSGPYSRPAGGVIPPFALCPAGGFSHES